jgi:hypothetical protein
MSDLVDKLRSRSMPGSIMSEAADEIDRLRAAKTAALKLADERAKEAVELRAKLASARKALEAIKQATIDVRICDDVAWFDAITTLHDFCDDAIRAIGAFANVG